MPIKNILHYFIGSFVNIIYQKPALYSFVNTDKTIKVEFGMSQKETAYYKGFFKNKLVLNTSELGIVREDANFYADMKIVKVSEAKAIHDNYSMLQGKRKRFPTRDDFKSQKQKTQSKNETEWRFRSEDVVLNLGFFINI